MWQSHTCILPRARRCCAIIFSCAHMCMYASTYAVKPMSSRHAGCQSMLYPAHHVHAIILPPVLLLSSLLFLHGCVIRMWDMSIILACSDAHPEQKQLDHAYFQTFMRHLLLVSCKQAVVIAVRQLGIVVWLLIRVNNTFTHKSTFCHPYVSLVPAQVTSQVMGDVNKIQGHMNLMKTQNDELQVCYDLLCQYQFLLLKVHREHSEGSDWARRSENIESIWPQCWDNSKPCCAGKPSEQCVAKPGSYKGQIGMAKCFGKEAVQQ